MHSRSLYQFCCWDDVEGALLMLETFDDIDIMYRDGDIIRAMIFKNHVTLLKATLDYFENKQFPVKDSKYEEASQKLIEILEDSVYGSNPEISTIVSEYIGSDIAVLKDVDDLSRHSPVPHSVLVSAAVSKLSNIECCIEAAKIGDVSVIQEHLDPKNRAHKIAVVSAAVHNQQEDVIGAVVEMIQDAKQKAAVLRMAGDIFTQSSLFGKAEEYYDKSLKIDANSCITYSKMGALYQCWSAEPTVDTDIAQKLMLQDKAIKSYDKALEFKSKHIKYTEVQERLDIVVEQLKHLHLLHDSQDSAKVEGKYDVISELLSYISEEEDEIDSSGSNMYETSDHL